MRSAGLVDESILTTDLQRKVGHILMDNAGKEGGQSHVPKARQMKQGSCVSGGAHERPPNWPSANLGEPRMLTSRGSSGKLG